MNAERGKEKMKKLAILILIMCSAILLTWVSSSYAAEFLGYTMVPKQAKFYTIILGMIGASVGMVTALHAALWLADLRKKRKATVVKLAFGRDAEAFGGGIAAAAQPAK
jgi:hypothetical protein